MTDKIVTHEDLPALRRIQEAVGHSGCGPLVDRLIAAAEADQPPLPEGWVLHTTPAGCRAVFWHRDGSLYQWDDDESGGREPFPYPSSTTVPLRPAVTEADVEKAARAARAAYLDGDTWDKEYQDVRDDWMKTTRAAIDALDIEVRS